VGALAQRVEDSDLDVATAALNALAKGGETARPATTVVLRRTTHGDPDTRIQAIRTLEAIDADRATTVAGLIPVLSTDSARVRRAAVIYLGRRGTKAMPAISAIRNLLLDPDEEVRKEAAKAILSIEKGL
jgi:HEAT repeat protein